METPDSAEAIPGRLLPDRTEGEIGTNGEASALHCESCQRIGDAIGVFVGKGGVVTILAADNCGGRHAASPQSVQRALGLGFMAGKDGHPHRFGLRRHIGNLLWGHGGQP